MLPFWQASWASNREAITILGSRIRIYGGRIKKKSIDCVVVIYNFGPTLSKYGDPIVDDLLLKLPTSSPPPSSGS